MKKTRWWSKFTLNISRWLVVLAAFFVAKKIEPILEQGLMVGLCLAIVLVVTLLIAADITLKKFLFGRSLILSISACTTLLVLMVYMYTTPLYPNLNCDVTQFNGVEMEVCK